MFAAGACQSNTVVRSGPLALVYCGLGGGDRKRNPVVFGLPMIDCLLWEAYICMACPIVRKFAMHLTVLAALRALFKEGSRIEMSKAIMPITTSNSTSVKPRDVFRICAFI